MTVSVSVAEVEKPYVFNDLYKYFDSNVTLIKFDNA